MPAVSEIEIPDTANIGVAIEGSTNVWPESADEAVLPAFDKFNQPVRYFDVFNRRKAPFNINIETSAPWILVSNQNPFSPSTSTRDYNIEKEQRQWVGVDWKNVPEGITNATIKISDGTRTVLLKLNIFNPQTPSVELDDFIEADGYVSIEAEHFSKNVGSNLARWEKIPNLGRTLSSMSIFPVTASSIEPPQNSPCLEYNMFLFDSGNVNVETILSPSLNFVSGRGLRYALSFDNQPPRIVTAVPAVYPVGDGALDWEKTVSDSVRILRTPFTLEKPGEHTLKVWMVDPGIVLQKIVVDCGGEKPSYLGPPESFHK
jgi:hypothetical protein